MTNGNTITLHRVLKAPTSRVYKAFLDADALAKFMAPHGYTGRVHNLTPEVGGGYRMSFTNFTNGRTHYFGGRYLELVPNQRISYTDKFEDPGPPGEMRTTVTLSEVSVGTELRIVQEGVPAQIPSEACYLGWQETLSLLALLVEVEIPDEPL